jgi:preprotein translocase subunit YajC
MKMKPIIFLILAVVLLGGLFLLIKPQKQEQNLTKTQTTTPSVAPESKVKTFDIVVKARKVVSGPETIKVTEGDEVVIKITADEDEELHLHGYDKSIDLEKDKPAELSFTANLTGRFPYELEKSKTDIGALEVSPK